MRPLSQRLWPAALAALVTVAVAVPVTWSVATGRDSSSSHDLPDLPPGPQNRDELRAQLPTAHSDGVLPELPNEEPITLGLAPGDYEVHVICGLLRRQGVVEAVDIALRTPMLNWELTVPCPSTVLRLDALLQMSEPAGALTIGAVREPSRPRAYLALVHVVPQGAGG